MRFLKTLSFITAIIILYSGSLSSQQTNLTLRHVIDNAVKNNIAVKKIENNIDIQEGNIKTKYGSLIPTLSLNGGWQRSNQVTPGGVQNIGGFNIPLDSRNETNFNYSLSLRSDVTLFNGFSNYESIDIAKMQQSYNFIQLEKTRQDITLKVLADYVAVLRNQQILKINEASLENARRQLEAIRLFVEAGKRTMSDVYKQDVQVAQFELLVEQSKNNLDKSIQDLVFDSNLPQDRQYTVSGTEFSSDLAITDVNTYVLKNSNTNTLVNNAVKNRDDFRAVERSIDISESNLELTRNSLIFPTVTGFSTYGLSAPKIGDINDSRVFTIGINISYPIFQGFSVSNQRQQAQINLRAANQDLEQVKNQITLEINKAVLDLKSLNKQIEISDRNIKSAEQDRILAEESFRVGLATILDFQTAETNYNNALIERSNLIYNFQLSQKQLEYYQGVLKY